MSDAQVTIAGNLTREPSLTFTTSGRAKVDFGVAVSRKWKNAAGEQQEQTSFYNIVAWATLAENVAASLHKGNRVVVSGRLEQREYETKEGEKRNVVEIIADEVGPSLRWARAEVERVDREKVAPRTNRAPDPVYGDEEPF